MLEVSGGELFLARISHPGTPRLKFQKGSVLNANPDLESGSLGWLWGARIRSRRPRSRKEGSLTPPGGGSLCRLSHKQQLSQGSLHLREPFLSTKHGHVHNL